MEPLFVELTENSQQKCLQNLFRNSISRRFRRYGSDKPDLRFEMKMIDLTEDLKSTGFKVFADAITASWRRRLCKGICVVGGSSLSRSQIDELTEFVKRKVQAV